MDRVISISLGEVVLKGLNRKYFENKLIDNIKRVLKGLGDFKIYKEQGKIYIEGVENEEEIDGYAGEHNADANGGIPRRCVYWHDYQKYAACQEDDREDEVHLKTR